MPNMMTMINVSDMGRSVKFYRETLGLKLRFESPGWSEFEVGNGVTLALHGGAQPSDSGVRSGEPVAGTASIGFGVENVDKACQELKAKGARFVMDPRDREREGVRLAVLVDPDGFPISLAQPLRR